MSMQRIAFQLLLILLLRWSSSAKVCTPSTSTVRLTAAAFHAIVTNTDTDDNNNHHHHSSVPPHSDNDDDDDDDVRNDHQEEVDVCDPVNEEKGKNDMDTVAVEHDIFSDENGERITTKVPKIEKLSLKEKIQAIALEYEQSHYENTDINSHNPLKLLRTLAPKIPAIKRAPDFTLRITGASVEDARAAAYAIYLVAQNAFAYRSSENDDGNGYDFHKKILHDRRFEQLVECAMCGVDMELAMRLVSEEEKEEVGSDQRETSNVTTEYDTGSHCDGTEDNLCADQEKGVNSSKSSQGSSPSPVKDGLSILDASLLAWSLALLGVDELESLANEECTSILSALANRCKRILIQNKMALFSSNDNSCVYVSSDNSATVEGLAKDAVWASWAFACVSGCTGVKSNALFHVCCEVLCSPLMETNKQMEDLVDRLTTEACKIPSLTKEEPGRSPIEEVDNQKSSDTFHRDALSYHTDQTVAHLLSHKNIADLIWSCALHGSDGENVKNLLSILRPILITELSSIDKQLKDERIPAVDQNDPLSLSESGCEKSAVDYNSKDTLSENEPTDNDFKKDYCAEQSDMRENQPDSESEITIITEEELASSGTSIEVIDAEEIFAAEASEMIDESTEECSESKEDISLKINSDNVVAPSIETKFTFLAKRHKFNALGTTETNFEPGEVINISSSIMINMGDNFLSKLEGRDLANIVWSVARYVENSRTYDRDEISSLLNHVGEWSLFRIGSKLSNVRRSSLDNTLEPISPSDLSRILWAFSICESKDLLNHEEGHYSISSRLSLEGIHLASSNINHFTADDLAKILWAYVASGACQELHQSNMAFGVGRIITAIEASLQRWERGLYSRIKSLSSPLRSNTIFGESITSSDIVEKMGMHDSTLSLPPIEDLRIDPSTLCKCAWAATQLSIENPLLKNLQSEIVRITAKIFSQKEGRLFQFAKPDDVSRLCWSYVKLRCNGIKKVTSSSMIRRVVQLINDGNLDLEEMAPKDMIPLLWSLSEAGAKMDKQSNKLILLCKVPHEKLSNLSPTHSLMLLQAIVTLQACNDFPLIEKAVVSMEKSLENFSSDEKADAIIVFARLVSSLRSEGNAEITDNSRDNVLVGEVKSKTKDADKPEVFSSEDIGDDYRDSDVCEGENSQDIGNSIDIKELSQKCYNIFDKLSSDISENIAEVGNHQIGNILFWLIAEAIQSDSLVMAIENEIESRMKQLEWGSPGDPDETMKSLVKNMEDSLVDAANIALELRDACSEGKEREKMEDTTISLIESLSQKMSSTAAISCKLSAQVKKVQCCTNQDTEKMLHTIEDNALFELGKAKDLAESYRRIEFNDDHFSQRKSRLKQINI
eukprot:CAMPEP_0116075644 /NCGR_PEP_ID=MMETSP0322-20121206/16754_1 /TAXON_ID=163516 /ORGANISM="Leptocylindrus danicus var. apora, Strain B651" /LENGTH=1349 /DNA_ID=CAMNT_0003565735 /DNA_START=8 /DNA_END=4058 /DNA_ORIENTATION=+